MSSSWIPTGPHLPLFNNSRETVSVFWREILESGLKYSLLLYTLSDGFYLSCSAAKSTHCLSVSNAAFTQASTTNISLPSKPGLHHRKNTITGGWVCVRLCVCVGFLLRWQSFHSETIKKFTASLPVIFRTLHYILYFSPHSPECICISVRILGEMGQLGPSFQDIFHRPF